jgi:hypothetical protein
VAESRLSALYKIDKDAQKNGFVVLEKFKGFALRGKRYVPLFDYFKNVCSTLSLSHLIGF